MNLSLRDINTGEIVDQRNGLYALKRLNDNSNVLEIKKAASKLFDSTSEHTTFLYWVAELDGVAIQKGTAFDLVSIGLKVGE